MTSATTTLLGHSNATALEHVKPVDLPNNEVPWNSKLFVDHDMATNDTELSTELFGLNSESENHSDLQ